MLQVKQLLRKQNDSVANGLKVMVHKLNFQIVMQSCFFCFFFKCMNAKTKANALIKYEWKYTIINFAYSTIKFFARYLMKTCLETTLD